MHSFQVRDRVWHPVHRRKMQVVKFTSTGEPVCEYKDDNGVIHRLDFSADDLQSWEAHEAERRARHERHGRQQTDAVTTRGRRILSRGS